MLSTLFLDGTELFILDGKPWFVFFFNHHCLNTKEACDTHPPV